MKILELGKFYPPVRGGIETLLKSMCEGFVRKRADVECVVANERAGTVEERINGVQVRRVGSFGTLFSTSICPGYVRTALGTSAKIWHAHFPKNTATPPNRGVTREWIFRSEGASKAPRNSAKRRAHGVAK